MKVALIVGVYGALRRVELLNMAVDDIDYLNNGSLIKVTVPKTKTNIVRQFIIDEGEDPAVNLIEVFKKYAALRPQGIPNTRFFMRYAKGKCTRQAIGIHTIGGYPQVIAAFLKLENASSYTGHCFRRSSASMLAESGGDLPTVKRHCGWSSDKVAEGYIECSVNNKRKIAGQILGIKNPKAAGEGSSSNNNNSTIPVRVDIPETFDVPVTFDVPATVDTIAPPNLTIVASQSTAQVFSANYESSPSSKNVLEIKRMKNCTINVYQNQKENIP